MGSFKPTNKWGWLVEFMLILPRKNAVSRNRSESDSGFDYPLLIARLALWVTGVRSSRVCSLKVDLPKTLERETLFCLNLTAEPICDLNKHETEKGTH